MMTLISQVLILMLSSMDYSYTHNLLYSNNPTKKVIQLSSNTKTLSPALPPQEPMDSLLDSKIMQKIMAA